MSRLNSDDCIGCDIHGFPCTKCADDVFCGELGPGFKNGIQIITKDTSEHSKRAMMEWCLKHPGERVVKESSVREESETAGVRRDQSHKIKHVVTQIVRV